MSTIEDLAEEFGNPHTSEHSPHYHKVEGGMKRQKERVSYRFIFCCKCNWIYHDIQRREVV